MIWYNKKTLALELFPEEVIYVDDSYNFFGNFVIHTMFQIAIFQNNLPAGPLSPPTNVSAAQERGRRERIQA